MHNSRASSKDSSFLCKAIAVSILFSMAASLPARAASSEAPRAIPIGFSLFSPAQFPDVNDDVLGLRINLFYGEHYNVSFLDVGGLVNIVDGSLSGLEIAGVCNKVCSGDGALQVAGFVNLSEMEFSGIQIAGLANKVDDAFEGIQIGLINMVEDADGVQIGLYNKADDLSGLQIGLFNSTRDLVGIQIGLFNFIEESPVPFMPILNARF